MSRDPNDPQVDLSKNAATQAFDCLGLLAPPLRYRQGGRDRRLRRLPAQHPRDRRPPHRRRVLQAHQRQEPRARPAHHLQPHAQPLRPQLPAAVAPPRATRYRPQPAQLHKPRSHRSQQLLGRQRCFRTLTLRQKNAPGFGPEVAHVGGSLATLSRLAVIFRNLFAVNHLEA